MREPQQLPAPYPAAKARGGEIILRTSLQRSIFLSGLIGAIGLVMILGLLARLA